MTSYAALTQRACSACGDSTAQGQWWHLSNYYGLSGTFCPACYEKVSHDAFGMAKHPDEYAEICKKMEIKP